MSILTESVPKPTSIRRRIEQLRKALADLEYLLPVAERVHGIDKRETIKQLVEDSDGKLMRGDDPRLTKREESRHA